MSSRDYYKVTYTSKDSERSEMSTLDCVLDNDTEFNANQFKLYDDFTTDLRMNFNPIRNNFQELARKEARRRIGDPNDSGVDMENGNPLDDVTASNDSDLLENEVMVDPWSSMDSSNSPLTDSGPSASDDCTPSTSSEPPRGPLDTSPLSPDSRRLQNTKDAKPSTKHVPKGTDKARSRDLTLELETLESDPLRRRPHFLDEDYQPPSKSNIECRIPKPHFLDHSPSPDEFDERSDITNPNFLDDEVDGDDNLAQKKVGALPKRPAKPQTSTYSSHEDRPHRTSYRSTLHYGLESAARSSERDKRASQLYRGTWPGERDVWTGHDSSSVRSFSSNGSSDCPRPSSNLDNKMDCVFSLISLLSLSPENNADLSAPLLEMSRSVESCIAMRQAGCIPLLVQLIHSKVPRDTRDRAAKALRNIIHTQTDDKAGRREARVWRLLEQVREYCYVLEDVVDARKEGKEVIEDDATKHPSQSVAALMKLSFDEEHRHVVCQLGGLQALAALVSGDQAAHGSRTDDNTCLTMRKYAGMTLTNLTFGDGNNKSLLCSFKDFMLALVEQLESPNDDMRQVTAAVLRNLSWRADTNSKQVLREVGAVKGLTKAAMTCQKEATLKSVLSALWNLTAHCSMNKVALCSVDGALGFLVDMLSYNSPTKTLAIVENAGGIMRNVSSHIAVREDYRQILRERNCLSVLLQHLKSPSLTVVSNSCGTLWNLSARCPLDQEFLWDHGAVPMLRSLIHSKHKMIAMGSSAALKNLLNSKPGKTHIISLDTTARSMNLPALPTLGARKQKALEQELDQNLAETCDNIEPATSPSTSNRDEKNLFTATERQIAMNLERHRMTSSSPLMGALTSQISLSHSANLASYLSCSNTLLKGALVTRSTTASSDKVNRSDSKDSVTSTQSDSVFDRVTRTGKVPVPTPRSKDLMKVETGSEAFKVTSKPLAKDGSYLRYPAQPPIPPPRSTTDIRTNFTESGYDVDQDSCDQPVDYSRKYSETKTTETEPLEKAKTSETKKYGKKDSPSTFGDYQETDLDQPTDYSLRYAEHQSETGSDLSEPPGPSDTIKHFATEGTPYETPIIFSTATSMTDLRVIGKDGKPKAPSPKENPEVMTHSDEKDTCSIEDPPRHDNDLAATTPQASMSESETKRGLFDTKFSSGMVSPEKPVNYCDEGTPGCFSRVSSLSSVGEPTEEDCLAKKNAMATINVEPSPEEPNTSSSAKDKEGSKAVTFARSPLSGGSGGATPGTGGGGCGTGAQDTPLMFSRSSSLGSLPDCSHDDQGSVLSEFSRLPSGCISPSEIPDSPGQSVPQSPRPERVPMPPEPLTPPPEPGQMVSVFEERVSRFVVEHTPAAFSTATSLSSLTIDMEPKDKTSLRLVDEHPVRPIDDQLESDSERDEVRDHVHRLPQSSSTPNAPYKGTQTPSDVCKVYFTEDTPAILSKAGSNSNLSVLSIDSAPSGLRPAALGASDTSPDIRIANRSDAHDTSDSSNLSDAGDLLEECIQKGIAKVVKNKGPPSDVSSVPYTVRGDVYRSLPPYLRSSTETVKMSHEFARNIRDSRSCSSERSPPPPLPPKPAATAAAAAAAAPPRPPLSEHLHYDGRKQSDRRRSRPTLGQAESTSSLSLDSFGSTDRELFEQTVKAGLTARRTGPPGILPVRDGSLSSLSNESFGSTDKEVFERCVRAGMSRPRSAERRARHRDLDRDRRASADRALLRDVIERGAAAGPARHSQQQQHQQQQQQQQSRATKNAPPPPAPRARAGPGAPARGSTGSDDPRHTRRTGQTLSTLGCDDPAEDTGRILPILGCDNPATSDHTDTLAADTQATADTDESKTVEIEVKHILDDAKADGDDETKSEVKHILVGADGALEAEIEANVDMDIDLDDSSHYRHGIAVSEDKLLGHDVGLELDRALCNDVNNLDLENDFGYQDLMIDQSSRSMSQSTDVRNAEETFKIHSHAYHSILQITEDENATQSSKPQNRVEPFNYNVRNSSNDNLTINITDTSPTSKTNQLEDAADLLKMLEETGPSKSSLAPSIDPLSASRGSNECLAPRSANTTLESLPGDDLDRSNESYADVTDGSWSEPGSPKPIDTGTLTRKKKHELEWVDIGSGSKLPKPEEKSVADTWNDDTCPDDVTFPTISGSVHLISSIRSEVVDINTTLPDLLEKSEIVNISLSRPDLTDKLGEGHCGIEDSTRMTLDDVAEPSFASLVDDGEHRFDSIISSAIEKEAARLAAQLKSSQYGMENSVTSLTSLDLDNIRPPSNLGSLLSLSASGQWEESAAHNTKKSQKSRKKSLPVAMMVKRALSNSMHQGSSEHLDSNPISFLDNVKPPSEMENIDMEGSMVSVSSIVSEVAEMREKTPVVFDLKQPIQDFPLCSAFAVFQDLDKVNPPSLFDEMAESTIELEPTTAHQVYDDCVSNTLNVVTDIPSGSENCTPLPSDISSVESTPKRKRDPHYLTPKEKRYHSKDRYQTYTITDTVTESEIVLEVDDDFVTWTKSESDRSEEYVTACSDSKSKRKISAKQRRLEDRARYQTQTINVQNIFAETSQTKIPDPHIESLKQRLAAKRTMKQKRIEDAERFRTRTISEDIPPSPTFVTKDANFENVETTTGYDSLSSNELNHQQILDERQRDDDVFSRDADSGHNEDDFELNSTQMQTYTKSFRNYLPVIESPAAVDMCVVNNLKNIEMTASYRRTMQAQAEKNQHPSSSDFASYEGDSNSEDRAQSESDQESPMSRPKPKIIKPNSRRDESLDSNESLDKDDSPKAIRGRKKAIYVSPYRRNTPAAKKPATPAPSKPAPKTIQAPKTATNAKAHASAKMLNKTPTASKTPSANTSPKKSIPNRSPVKTVQQKPVSIPLATPSKPLPLERQGTFTKEDSTVPPKNLPVPDKKSTVPQYGKATSPTKPTASNTSPSRLPQLNRYSRPPATKANSKPAPKAGKRPAETAMKNSPSNHSLQSNDSGKTVTLASRGSRQGSTSSVNSVQSSKTNTKDVESKIASLWKRVEQTKKQPSKPDKRVWIESDKTETPKLIRSSTFEGQPKQSQVSSAQKQKSAIGIRTSQIPSLRPKSTPGRVSAPSTSNAKKPANTRVFARKQVNGQVNP